MLFGRRKPGYTTTVDGSVDPEQAVLELQKAELAAKKKPKAEVFDINAASETARRLKETGSTFDGSAAKTGEDVIAAVERETAELAAKQAAEAAPEAAEAAQTEAAKPELLLDSSYFVPWLLPSRARLFTPVSYTQRPAAASAKLCEGRIVVLVNGSPSAMVLPALFCENFECLDDYASTAVFASFLRVLNYASFYLTVFLPGAFVCLAVYLPELIPPQLLYKIEAAEKATPLPLFAEMLLVILLLEVIREAGLRMPQSLGHSVSLVAALILGDAAIATGLMSTPVIFVASITSIAVFVTPALYEPATLLRIGVVVAAGLAGPVGLAGAFFVLLLSLSGTGMLGVPYLAQHPFPQSPLAEDGVIRRNYRHLSRKGFNIWQKRRPRA